MNTDKTTVLHHLDSLVKSGKPVPFEALEAIASTGHIEIGAEGDELSKGGKAGLTAKKVQVTKNGKTFMQTVYVKNGEDTPSGKSDKSKESVATTAAPKSSTKSVKSIDSAYLSTMKVGDSVKVGDTTIVRRPDKSLPRDGKPAGAPSRVYSAYDASGKTIAEGIDIEISKAVNGGHRSAEQSKAFEKTGITDDMVASARSKLDKKGVTPKEIDEAVKDFSEKVPKNKVKSINKTMGDFQIYNSDGEKVGHAAWEESSKKLQAQGKISSQVKSPNGTWKDNEFSSSTWETMKGGNRDEAIKYLKDMGITWSENDNPGINWMRACMAAKKFTGTTNGTTVSDIAADATPPADQSKLTAADITGFGGVSAERLAQISTGSTSGGFSASKWDKVSTGDRATALQYLKDNGVSWKENAHAGINWMRAKQAATAAISGKITPNNISASTPAGQVAAGVTANVAAPKLRKINNLSDREFFDIHKRGERTITDDDKESMKALISSMPSMHNQNVAGITNTTNGTYSIDTKGREYVFSKLSNTHFICKVYEVSNKKSTSKPIRTETYILE